MFLKDSGGKSNVGEDADRSLQKSLFILHFLSFSWKQESKLNWYSMKKNNSFL